MYNDPSSEIGKTSSGIEHVGSGSEGEFMTPPSSPTNNAQSDHFSKLPTPKEESQGPITSLPSEIIGEFFSYLSLADLSKAGGVSTRWQAIAASPVQIQKSLECTSNSGIVEFSTGDHFQHAPSDVVSIFLENFQRKIKEARNGVSLDPERDTAIYKLLEFLPDNSRFNRTLPVNLKAQGKSFRLSQNIDGNPTPITYDVIDDGVGYKDRPLYSACRDRTPSFADRRTLFGKVAEFGDHSNRNNVLDLATTENFPEADNLWFVLDRIVECGDGSHHERIRDLATPENFPNTTRHLQLLEKIKQSQRCDPVIRHQALTIKVQNYLTGFEEMNPETRDKRYNAFTKSERKSLIAEYLPLKERGVNTFKRGLLLVDAARNKQKNLAAVARAYLADVHDKQYEVVKSAQGRDAAPSLSR